MYVPVDQNSPAAMEATIDITSTDGLFAEDSRESCNATLAKEVELNIMGLSPSKRTVPTKPAIVKLLTFTGVYLPCLQSMLGVVLFLRMSWVTAQAGVGMTILLFVVCQSVGFFTATSICALVTNGKIAGGGVYYLISRTIGIETGLSIGLLVFTGSTIGVAFSLLGAIETMRNTFDTSNWVVHEATHQALILLAILGSVVLIGMKYVSMVGSACLVIVMMSLLCSFIGLISFINGDTNSNLSPSQHVWYDNVKSNYTVDPSTNLMPSLTSLISVVYPGTTGYMAGATRSGLLANPARSIPLGTITSMLTLLAINVLVILAFGSTISNQTLKTDKLILSTVAWPHKKVVNIGIFFSAVGATLQSLAGNPRMLAAMANDHVIPLLRPFAAKDSEEPRRAVFFFVCMACLPCIAGNLDFLSPLLTMSSLILCATLNFACFSMAYIKAPGFRPKWRYFHWSTALMGALWSLLFMFFFSWMKALVAIALFCVIRAYVKCLGFKRDWGSSIRGMQLELACHLLKALNTTSDEEHTKNWRPQVLVFCTTDNQGIPTRPMTLHFANQLKEGKGLIEVVGLLGGKDDKMYEVAQSATINLREHLRDAHISGFGHVYACKHVTSSMGTVVEASGMGSLRSNTVILGWPSDWRKKSQETDESVESYVDMLHEVIMCKKSLLVLKNLDKFPSNNQKPKGVIDVWWILHDGGLVLLIPYLLHLHPVWRNCKLRLFSIISPKEDGEQMKARLQNFLESARIDAEVHVVEFHESTLSTLMCHRTKTDLEKKKQRLDKFAVSALSFVARETNSYVQIVEEINSTKPVGATEGLKRVKSKTNVSSSQEPEKDPRMRHAKLVNAKILEYSSDAALVVINLPRLIGIPAVTFMTYVDTVTMNLPGVLFIRGSGREVITMNA